MMHYRELERRCAERLAELEREQARARLDAALRAGGRWGGASPRAQLAAGLVTLAARLDATATLARREDTALTPAKPA